MEEYLVEQYGVIESKDYMETEADIEEYFYANGPDYFDCGEGYYQDEVGLIVKAEDKFYNVTVSADIDSAKQDRGDRLYWVDRITNVSYKEIDKPKPKPKGEVQYSLLITNEQRTKLESFMKENYIKF